MTKITLKIERHYGNKDLTTIIEKLVSRNLSNFKFNSAAKDKPYFNIDTNITAIHQEGSNR